MEALFYHIYCLVQRRKIFFLAVALLFLATCTWIASKIRFEEDITQVIPVNEDPDELTRALKQVNFADKITVRFTKEASGNTALLVDMASQFVDSLASDSLYVRAISGKIDQEAMEQTYDFVYQHLPLVLDSALYRKLDTLLSPAAIAERVRQNYNALLSPTGFVVARYMQQDPLGLGLLGLEKIRKQGLGDNFILMDGFIATKDSSQILLFVDPVFQGADTDHNIRFVDHLEQLRNRLQSQFKAGASIAYYGSAFIAVANAKQIKTDILTTVLVSMSVLMLLLIFFYKRAYIPILVFIPTVFAVLFALACLYLYKPVISAISLSIGAVLLGITIDYTLHVLTHFKKSADVRALYQELTRPLLMSGATNAVAFLCLLFVHSKALIDLGIFASICIFSSSVFTLLIIPHLYKPKREIRYNSLIDRLAAFPFERSKLLIGLCLLLLLLSFFTSGRVGYNNNLADLNFIPAEQRQVEAELDALMNTSAKSLYLVATGSDFETVAKKVDHLNRSLASAQQRGWIKSYTGMTAVPLSATAQRQKIREWNAFWQMRSKEKVIADLQSAGGMFGFSSETHMDFYRLLQKDHQPMSVAELKQQNILGYADFAAEKDGFYTLSTLVKLDESQRITFLDALKKTDDVLVIDRQNLNEHFLGQLRNDFNRLVGYSFFAVLLILWIFFRRIELVLLSAIPIALTGLITTGLMGLFGLEFNIFSAIVCTLVFGHGVDFSIFMTAALQKQYSTGRDELQTYRTSILLAVLTTVLAIGALIFAKHPALLSIASVSLIGVFAAVIVTFVFYPILFRFFISDRAKQGKSPFTIRILLFSILFFVYYGLGCVILSFFCRTLLLLIPIGKARRERVFRKMMASFMKSVLYLHPYTSNKTYNPYHETFEKPAIIIANHSSFLDTLSLGMLVPRAIFLVNDWVWNSPIFGRAVKALGFYPVSQGLEGGVDFLREKMQQGYSLIVFPEGTRSYDNVVKRFHKGAFYLAEQFDADIVPIYLLGNGDVLPKGDILIFGGALSPVIGKRMAPGEWLQGRNYAAGTKEVTKYFRQQYRRWRLEIEGRDYFRNKLLLAYYFKDEEILQAVKRDFKNFAAYYDELNRLLGEQVKITHLSESYGQFDYLLSLQNGYRKVRGIIADEEKRSVAESIYWSRWRDVSFSDQIDTEGGILLIHPAYTRLADWQDSLHIFQEIYTFKEEPLLQNSGWKATVLSACVIRYEKREVRSRQI
ncbi:1-acyl-sn-glycerol-3-phosphate acyltransferase [Sphingobacterium oryzagri]|uniref:1-acyl-sn-glycerol-3-phosphate acyltransferase n=1 Tax=Sphingobacterium oryzagri TaxID=3025669 RepID=A0ABY7WFT5_9SPHI|nr:1-acyl-sn-glycerol-3-phosphate acyltransferase [Sphingobacterium sp. KACC 22765]WDF68481.1 1-acyl-sn-glycerol-3-phosphate acyltransferase [Sphingobacterium sp. KACC 22765]